MMFQQLLILICTIRVRGPIHIHQRQPSFSTLFGSDMNAIFEILLNADQSLKNMHSRLPVTGYIYRK